MSEHHEQPDDPQRWRNAHPDFDGHLEKPLEQMTITEHLEWIEEGMRLLHWARHQVQHMLDDSPR